MTLKYKELNLLSVATLITGVFFGFHSLGWAGGYYTCPAPAVLSSDGSSCSDGSIPMFQADPVCSSSQVLQNHVCVTPASTNPSNGTDQVSADAETIFNWGEKAYPEYFSSHEVTQSADPWFYRYYQGTDTYFGVNKQDSNVYVLGGAFGSTAHRVDTVANVLTMTKADPVCTVPQVLQNHACVTPALTDPSKEAETIFNWAEQAYPNHFPSHEATQAADPWLYRHYQGTDTYVGVNKQDNSVYVLGGTFGADAKLIDTVPNVLSMAKADPSSLYGVWRTNIPGAVWTSPGTYNDWLHVSTGVAVGDLIIRPDGTYIWNSYGGKSGNWTQTHGDSDYPIVLIDTVENKQWKVGVDPKHIGGRDIMIWDGNSIYYDGRK